LVGDLIGELVGELVSNHAHPCLSTQSEGINSVVGNSLKNGEIVNTANRQGQSVNPSGVVNFSRLYTPGKGQLPSANDLYRRLFIVEPLWG